MKNFFQHGFMAFALMLSCVGGASWLPFAVPFLSASCTALTAEEAKHVDSSAAYTSQAVLEATAALEAGEIDTATYQDQVAALLKAHVDVLEKAVTASVAQQLDGFTTAAATQGGIGAGIFALVIGAIQEKRRRDLEKRVNQ